MNLKTNINKIHSDILSLYENVEILEKSSLDKGNYFELIINENMELKALIPFTAISNSVFEWSYYSNPNDENSHLVERTSSLDSFQSDIKDILENKRFSEDYINSL